MEKATKNSGVNWCKYLYQCQDWHKHTWIHIKSYHRGSPNWKKVRPFLGLFPMDSLKCQNSQYCNLLSYNKGFWIKSLLE